MEYKGKKSTLEDLKNYSEDQVLRFIREVLRFEYQIKKQLRHCLDRDFDLEHYRFDMSGYDYEGAGSCTLHNQIVLNKFAYLGIYDYTNYLFLDFYKGTPTLYLQYFGNPENKENLSFDYDGYGTAEIIYEVFKLTILSNKKTRRRE